MANARVVVTDGRCVQSKTKTVHLFLLSKTGSKKPNAISPYRGPAFTILTGGWVEPLNCNSLTLLQKT